MNKKLVCALHCTAQQHSFNRKIFNLDKIVTVEDITKMREPWFAPRTMREPRFAARTKNIFTGSRREPFSNFC